MNILKIWGLLMYSSHKSDVSILLPNKDKFQRTAQVKDDESC